MGALTILQRPQQRGLAVARIGAVQAVDRRERRGGRERQRDGRHQPSRRRRIASGDNATLGTNPSAGLAAIMLANSCSEWVEVKMTGDETGPPASCSARLNPLSPPRSMSTTVTSG